jgi:hypothetical protein
MPTAKLHALVGKAVVLTDGKAGTVENVWLDELQAYEFRSGATMESGPSQRSNSRRPAEPAKGRKTVSNRLRIGPTVSSSAIPRARDGRAVSLHQQALDTSSSGKGKPHETGRQELLSPVKDGMSVDIGMGSGRSPTGRRGQNARD